MNLKSEDDPRPSYSKPTMTPRAERKRRLAIDYPSFAKPETVNPLTKRHSSNLNRRGQVLEKLGVIEADLARVPRITHKVVEAVGSTKEAVAILEGDDSEDSLRFMEKWNLLTEKDRQECHLEDVIVAAGLTGRRFMELLTGASFDHGEFLSKMFKNHRKIQVLKSTFKAATEETPIVKMETNADGSITSDIVGYEPADVKAMELFFKLTGDIKPAGGINVNSNNQTANINTPPAPERDPLQSMDKFLLELDEVRKPKQLQAPPVIPVEVPANAPEIEYLDLS